MAEPFIGEIRIFGCNFAPKDWAFCNGTLIAISQNQTLYALLGTTYGGDGRSTFALPDLRGRVPSHVGDGIRLGQTFGAENVSLDIQTLAAHSHDYLADGEPADKNGPRNDRRLAISSESVYAAPSQLTSLNAGTTENLGDGQAHNNMQPVQVMNFCIALNGLFPPRD